mmetsp:Transcript_48824/g.126473  ORF Transcript_48824/g.126473 Transcript_48824/m.126473 type:complete len:159 (-) Transcript_48824:7-483(-)
MNEEDAVTSLLKEYKIWTVEEKSVLDACYALFKIEKNFSKCFNEATNTVTTALLSAQCYHAFLTCRGDLRSYVVKQDDEHSSRSALVRGLDTAELNTFWKWCFQALSVGVPVQRLVCLKRSLFSSEEPAPQLSTYISGDFQENISTVSFRQQNCGIFR